MSTRSMTLTYKNGKQVYNHYRHYDGYPEGHGADLAAQLVGLKTLSGPARDNTYLEEMKHMGCELEDEYTIHGDIEYLYKVNLDTPITMTMIKTSWQDSWEDIMSREPAYEGSPEDFFKFIGEDYEDEKPATICYTTTLILPREDANALTRNLGYSTEAHALIAFKDGFTVDLVHHIQPVTDKPYAFVLRDTLGAKVTTQFVDDPFARCLFHDEFHNNHLFKILVDYEENAETAQIMETTDE